MTHPVERPLNGVGARVESIEKVKENKKVLHFAVFAIVNELLIIKNRISPAY